MIGIITGAAEKDEDGNLPVGIAIANEAPQEVIDALLAAYTPTTLIDAVTNRLWNRITSKICSDPYNWKVFLSFALAYDFRISFFNKSLSKVFRALSESTKQNNILYYLMQLSAILTIGMKKYPNQRFDYQKHIDIIETMAVEILGSDSMDDPSNVETILQCGELFDGKGNEDSLAFFDGPFKIGK